MKLPSLFRPPAPKQQTAPIQPVPVGRDSPVDPSAPRTFRGRKVMVELDTGSAIYIRRVPLRFAEVYYPVTTRIYEARGLGRSDGIVYAGWVQAGDVERVEREPAFLPQVLIPYPQNRWNGRVKRTILSGGARDGEELMEGPKLHSSRLLWNLRQAVPETVREVYGRKPSTWQKVKVGIYALMFIAVLVADIILFNMAINPAGPSEPDAATPTTTATAGTSGGGR